MLLDVKDTKFVRDTNSMALINNDNRSKEEYYEKVRMIKAQKEEINNIKSEMAEIRSEISEVKELLIQLLGKGRNG